jgi:hypothetical protein
MQNVIDVLFVLLMLGFLALVLKELGKSQQLEEKYTAMPNMLRLAIDLKRPDGQAPQRVTQHFETVEECQAFINNIDLFRILRAGVWDGATQTHVMNSKGVLEAV